MAEPLPGTVQQAQGVRKLPFGLLVLLLLSFSVPLWGLYHASVQVAQGMLARDWATYLGIAHHDEFYFKCMLSSTCGEAFQNSIPRFFPNWTWTVPALAFLLYAVKSKPKTYSVRDPGTAWWAQKDDPGIDQYTRNDPRRPENTLHGYLGHLLTVEKTGSISYGKTIPLYVRMAALSENVLILGGVGAGKTRGYFRPLLMLAALLGFSVIVFDLKYPQADSGFFDMVGFWKKAGKRVMMFTPFSQNTMRLPLLESVTDYASALSMSATIMPPPEYGPEPGKHYRDRDRGVLAAFILAVAQSDTPSLAELLKIAQYTPTEMKAWFERQAAIDEDSEIVQNLKGVFGQGDREVAQVLQGIKNALRIFYNPLVARATTGKEGENMNIRAAFRSTTMIYVGIQQEYMMEGDGVVLLQLVKRYIDKQLQREAEFQGGSLKRHVAYVMDEFPSFGQLPYMMRSLGVLRSYNVSHHIGVQNLEQLAVVYGDNYSNALTTNVIGRKIFFPLAVESEERKIFSEALGMTTVYDIGEGDSRRSFMGTALDDTTRQTMSLRKIALPLLPPEQFPHFRSMEAVVMGRGSNPMRVFLPAIEEKFLEGPDFPTGSKRIPNALADFYEQVNPERENMGRYTQHLIASGELGTSTSKVTPITQQESNPEEPVESKFNEWLESVLDAGARVRLAGENRDRFYLSVGRLPETLRPEALMRGNFTRGWTAKYGDAEVRLTPEGLAVLAGPLRSRVEEQAVFGAVLFWMERNSSLIEGAPERAEQPEKDRLEMQAVLQGRQLSLGLMPFRELFGAANAPLRRIGTRQYVDIDLDAPLEFARNLMVWQAQAQQERDPRKATVSEQVISPDDAGAGVLAVPEEEGVASGLSFTGATVPPPVRLRSWQNSAAEQMDELRLPDEPDFGGEEDE